MFRENILIYTSDSFDFKRYKWNTKINKGHFLVTKDFISKAKDGVLTEGSIIKILSYYNHNLFVTIAYKITKEFYYANIIDQDLFYDEEYDVYYGKMSIPISFAKKYLIKTYEIYLLEQQFSNIDYFGYTGRNKTKFNKLAKKIDDIWDDIKDYTFDYYLIIVFTIVLTGFIYGLICASYNKLIPISHPITIILLSISCFLIFIIPIFAGINHLILDKLNNKNVIREKSYIINQLFN